MAADIYRPAAVEQLKTLGSQHDLEFFQLKIKIANLNAKDALNYACENSFNSIIDTAEVQIDDSMMMKWFV